MERKGKEEFFWKVKERLGEEEKKLHVELDDSGRILMNW